LTNALAMLQTKKKLHATTSLPRSNKSHKTNNNNNKKMFKNNNKKMSCTPIPKMQQ
jgi:hypothetical protein